MGKSLVLKITSPSSVLEALEATGEVLDSKRGILVQWYYVNGVPKFIGAFNSVFLKGDRKIERLDVAYRRVLDILKEIPHQDQKYRAIITNELG